ncbi:hypothetical protein FBULB1_13286 [Fusarium bulbicola]|nr:hypothetical protein FBULB1_13286 [Fusarium bulbicola]
MEGISHSTPERPSLDPIEPGFTKSAFIAIKVAKPWQFDETEAWVPPKAREICQIPEELKIHGKLHLYPGEEGFLFGESENEEWGIAEFKRDKHSFVVLIPINRIIMGRTFRELREKLLDRLPMTENKPLISGSRLDTYIRSLWRISHDNIGPLKTRGLPQRLVDTVFNNPGFDDLIEAMIGGIIEPARRLMEDGRFTLQDLTTLPQITENYPSKNCRGIYVRIYTHLKGRHPDAVGVYVGQSQTSMWKRQLSHDDAIDDPPAGSGHYQVARLAPACYRYAFPIMLFDQSETSQSFADLFNLAEQTVLLLLNSYTSDSYTVAEDDEAAPGSFTVMRLRAVLLSNFSATARETSDWPQLEPVGCNRLSPLFQSHNTDIKAFHIYPPQPGARSFSLYKQHVYFNENRHRNDFKATVQARKTDGSHVVLSFSIGKSVREALAMPKRMEAFLVFEIMHDGKSHDIPWVPCPSVGPYENFERVSSLGVRVEYFDGLKKKWLSIPLQCALRTDSWSKQMEADNTEDLLRQYRKWMMLIQILQGITFTGDLNGFEQSPYFIGKQIVQLEFDHLQQTCRWVEQPRKFEPAPALALWRDNCLKMEIQFGGPWTVVNPSAPPSTEMAFWTLEHCDEAMRNRPRQCDTYQLSTLKRAASSVICERDPSRQDVWICRRCSVLGRPCTFSPRSVLRSKWGEKPPHMKSTRPNAANFSRYPDGPFRLLTFWPNLRPEDRLVTTKVDESFQLFEQSETHDPSFATAFWDHRNEVNSDFLDDGDISMSDRDDTESSGSDKDEDAASQAGSNDSYVN